MDIRKEIRNILKEEFDKSKKEIFFRKTKYPLDDIKRNFSCYADAWFDKREDAVKYEKEEGAFFSNGVKQDPITARWCGYSEMGLSAYVVRNKEEFYQAIKELKDYRHLNHIQDISVFKSKDWSYNEGSDGEDVFINGEYLFNIEEGLSYEDFLSKL